jgi:hypothetical protein
MLVIPLSIIASVKRHLMAADSFARVGNISNLYHNIDSCFQDVEILKKLQERYVFAKYTFNELLRPLHEIGTKFFGTIDIEKTFKDDTPKSNIQFIFHFGSFSNMFLY